MENTADLALALYELDDVIGADVVKTLDGVEVKPSMKVYFTKDGLKKATLDFILVVSKMTDSSIKTVDDLLTMGLKLPDNKGKSKADLQKELDKQIDEQTKNVKLDVPTVVKALTKDGKVTVEVGGMSMDVKPEYLSSVPDKGGAGGSSFTDIVAKQYTVGPVTLPAYGWAIGGTVAALAAYHVVNYFRRS